MCTYCSVYPNVKALYLTGDVKRTKMELSEALKVVEVKPKTMRNMEITFLNGSTITLRSGGIPEKLRGLSVDFVDYDQYADFPEESREILKARSDK
jgi:hypothetical protein